MTLIGTIWSKLVILDENFPNSLILGGKNDVICQNLGKVVKTFFLPKFGEKNSVGVNMVEFD